VGRDRFLVGLMGWRGDEHCIVIFSQDMALAAPSTDQNTFASSWRATLQGIRRRLVGERLAPEDRDAFAEEIHEKEIRRLRALTPLALVMHVAHALIYRVPDSQRASLPPGIVHWHDLIVRLHIATIPVTLAIILVVFRFPRSAVGRQIMALTAAAYLSHGAIASGVDQLKFANMDAFTGYCFGSAVICSFPFLRGLTVYSIGFAVVAVALMTFQPDASLRLSAMLNATMVVTSSVLVGSILAAARRRDFAQRRTIAHQRDELASLNSDLEHRVDEQVAEIVRRAEEVNKLNAQLRSQIRARSTELQVALAQLALQRGDEGLLHDGDVIGDRFEVGERIGAGAMGLVYTGTDRVTGARVAIKVIKTNSSMDIDSMRRFLGEASAAAAFTHPAVVGMVHVDIAGNGLLYQVQELVTGQSLDEVLQAGPWAQADVARFGAVLCDALAAAHSHGVVHRDVKPSNVMLTPAGPGLKLLDFGLAKLMDEVSRDTQSQTATGLIVGTPAYMAPEQVLGHEISSKVDVYSSGVLMFQLLTGRLAFETDGASKVMISHVAREAPDVRAIRDGVCGELADLVATCLVKDPALRPDAATIGASLAALADALGAETLPAIARRMGAAASGAVSDSDRNRSIARRLGAFS
jgi:serine/threonine-protein kinase